MWPGSFLRGIARVQRNAVPQKAIATAKAALIPVMYASRTPGRTSAEKAVWISEAPIESSMPGLTPGAASGKVANTWFTKAA